MPRPMEGDVAYVGADVQAVLGVPSAAACKALCSAHAGCYFFTFSPSKSNSESGRGGRRQSSPCLLEESPLV